MRVGSAAVTAQCQAVDAWAARAGKPKRLAAGAAVAAPAWLQQRIAGLATPEIEHAYRTIQGA